MSVFPNHGNKYFNRRRFSLMADPTITTTATGRTSAPPDEVDLQFTARAIDPDVTTARRTVADQAVALRQELDVVGIPMNESEQVGSESGDIHRIARGNRTPILRHNRTKQPKPSPSFSSNSIGWATFFRLPLTRQASKLTRSRSRSKQRRNENFSEKPSPTQLSQHEKRPPPQQPPKRWLSVACDR